MLNKVSKTIGWLRKLQNILQRSSLITIYKLFIRPYLYFGDVIYNQACNRVLSSETGVQRHNGNNRRYRGTSREAEDSIVNFVAFIKLSRFSHLGIYLTLFL